MPNWKKVVVSGSDAALNSVSGSSFVYSGAEVVAQTYLRSLNSTGDEGGELFLNKAVTNTTITGGVTVDVYQNKLRFFEQGGSARGFYLDITTGGAGVGTNLASGGGTVTSVSASGTVSGITLGGGPITGAGTLTLSGTISGLTNSNLSGTAGITNANLANSTITIAGTSTSLGGSIAQSTILAGSGVFSGSAQITGLTNSNLSGTAGITNANLANSSITIGTTAVSLGATSTTLAGLTAAQITGSLKIVNGSTKVIDTTVGTLYDVYGGASVNFGSNQLLNYYGANVVNWGSNYLLSNNSTSATTMSIDWENRYLADTAATQRLKWTTSGVQVTGSLRSTGGNVVVTGSLLVQTSNVRSIDSSNRVLYSTTTSSSVDWEGRALYDGGPGGGSNVASLIWGQRRLYDSSNILAANWQLRTLTNASSTTILDWSGTSGNLTGTASWASNVTTALTASSITPLNQTVKITGSLVVSGSVDTVGGFIVSDTVGVPSADLGAARILRDTTGGVTLNYASQTLYGAGALPALNWRYRYLIGSDGLTTTADWKDMRLYSSASAPASKSVDWDTRQLWAVDTLGGSVAVANWSVEKLYDDLGVTSVSWNARRLHDDSGNMSLHYGARSLIDASGGATTFEWDAPSTAQRYANQSYYYLRTQVDQNTQEEFTRVDSYTFQPEGRILQGVTYNGYVNNFDFVYLDNAAGEWSPVDKVSARATKMLGIAFSVGQDNCVLLEGHVQVNGANTADCPFVSGIDHGLPIYVSHSAGATTTVPTTTGDYVRIIGHAYYNSTNATDYWTMNFRPDHAWVEL